MVITHGAPGELVEFLSGFVDAPALPIAGGFSVASIESITPDAFSELFGAHARGPEAQGLAAMRIAVADTEATASFVAERGVAFTRQAMGCSIVDAVATSMGALIVVFTAS